METGTVISIGYERRTIDELVQVLLKYQVKRLLDIRDLPLSRKKGFSKTALSNNLQEVGIEYVHLKIAGNPYRKLKKNIQYCLELYHGYLMEHPEVIEYTLEAINSNTVAVLCCERCHNVCHRSVLLRTLLAENEQLIVLRVE